MPIKLMAVIVVGLAMFLGIAHQAVAETVQKPWSDWPNDSITEAQAMKDQGIFAGNPDGTFGPDLIVSERAVALVAQRLGADTPNLAQYSDEVLATKDWVIRYFLPNTGKNFPDGQVSRYRLLLMAYQWSVDPNHTSGVRPVVKHWPVSAMGQKIDNLLKRYKGSTLYGHGTLIAELSVKYNVPLDLALAMFGKESTFCSRGGSVRWNNPGNIKHGGGYVRYPTIEAGIEAYFKLLGGPFYRKYLDSGNYRGLYNKYAPPYENYGYVSSVESIRLRVVRPALGL